MNTTFDTAIQTVITLAVLLIGVLPAIIGTVRDRRIDIQLRDAEEVRDRRTGVLITFDLAYGPHEDRVFRANAGRRTMKRSGADGCPVSDGELTSSSIRRMSRKTS